MRKTVEELSDLARRWGEVDRDEEWAALSPEEQDGLTQCLNELKSFTTPPPLPTKATPKRRRWIGLGLVLTGGAVGLLGGDAVSMMTLLWWIAFALVLPGRLVVRVVGGVVLGTFFVADRYRSTSATFL